MPRKAFVADLQEAIRNNDFSRISELQPGEEDGSFMFTYTMVGADAQQVTIQVLVPGKSWVEALSTFAAVLTFEQRRRSS